ncbi:MAG: lysophospholipid acyltransferase family protein [Planctomycetota bacterium]|nr:lysophospholipid acyltransferase family protein [Planctomycetota bacterium]
MAKRSFIQRVGYSAICTFARLTAVVVFRMRCKGREKIPASGPLIVCGNHQSVLDPVLIGLAFNRQLNYLGRQSLFRFTPFRLLLLFLNAIALDRDGLGLSGLRESMRRIKRGEGVLLFPEGTRTLDGSVLPLQPGFCALARRGNVTVLPVGFDGAFEAWPRTAKLPSASKIYLCIGEPLAPEEIAKLDDKSLVAEVERRIRDCHQQARAGRQR